MDSKKFYDRPVVKNHIYEIDLAEQFAIIEIKDEPPLNVPVTITVKHSGKVLDVPEGRKYNGAKIIQYDYNGGEPNQQWIIEISGENTFMIKNKNSGKYLDVPNSSHEKGQIITQYDRTGNDNQRWYIERKNLNTFIFRNKESGLVLDINGGSKDNFAELIQYDYKENSLNQLFTPQVAFSNVKFIKDVAEIKKELEHFKFSHDNNGVHVQYSVVPDQNMNILHVYADAAKDDSIFIAVSADAGIDLLHFESENTGIETVSFDVIKAHAGASAGLGGELSAAISLIEAKASVFDLKLGFGVSTGAMIKDDSLEIEALGCGFIIGRKFGIKVFDNEIAIDFGRCTVM